MTMMKMMMMMLMMMTVSHKNISGMSRVYSQLGNFQLFIIMTMIMIMMLMMFICVTRYPQYHTRTSHIAGQYQTLGNIGYEFC